MRIGIREVAFASLVVGLVAGTYAMIVRPHALARQERIAQIASMDSALAALGNSTDDLEMLKSRLDDQQRVASSLSTRLTKESEISKKVDEVLQTAVANSLQGGNPQLMKRQVQNGVGIQPVKLQFSGNFNGFYAFLLQLESMPHFGRITDIRLAGAGAADGEISAEMTLLVYFTEAN